MVCFIPELFFFKKKLLHRCLIGSYNLGQKSADKLTKLSKIGFSMECFTADFLPFYTKKRENLACGCTAGYSPSNPSISGIFWKFPNFLGLKSFGNS